MGTTPDLQSKMAADKQAGSSMKLLLLVGLLLCSGAAAEDDKKDCLVKFEQRDDGFKGSLSEVKDREEIGEKKEMTSKTGSKGGKENALKLGAEYRSAIKDQMGIGEMGCTTSRWEIIQTGKMKDNRDWADAMGAAILETNTRVECPKQFNCIPVDFKAGASSFAIKNGKVIANDCLVKIEQGDTSFTGTLHSSDDGPAVAKTFEGAPLGETFILKKAGNLKENAVALAKWYKKGIQEMLGMPENKHGCYSSHWKIHQTGSMEGKPDWVDAMSAAILETNTRVKCPSKFNCIAVDFEAGTSSFKIENGEVTKGAAAAPSTLRSPTASTANKARAKKPSGSRRLL